MVKFLHRAHPPQFVVGGNTMNPEKGVHLGEDQLLRAVLDEADLSPLYLDITGEARFVLNEEFMEFVVPFLL